MTTPVDLAAIVAALAAKVTALTDIGLVHLTDPYSRTDVRPLLVSTIGGTDTLRAWWIVGPSLIGRQLAQAAGGGIIERDWTLELHAVEGIAEDGSHLATLRTNLSAAITAIDDDPTLASTVHRKAPCTITLRPHNTSMVGVGVGYAAIAVPITTLSQ